MYKNTCINTKYFHVEDNVHLERFRFVPHVDAKLKYLKDDKSESLLEIEYRLECHFEELLKEVMIFASVICQFEITKNDNEELELTSKTVFECAKAVELKLQEYLSSKKHGLTLQGLSIKPITIESWQKRNPNIGIGGFLN